MWCSSEYLEQQDGVLTDHLVCLLDVFVTIFFRSVAHMNKLSRALGAQAKWVLIWDIVVGYFNNTI